MRATTTPSMLLRLIPAIMLLAPAFVANAEDFEPFLARFRSAVLASDGAAVARDTRFPLTLKGQLDTDEVRLIGRSEFDEAFASLVEQDAGLSVEAESVRDYIRKMDVQATASRASDGSTARIGPFVFSRVGSAWKLVEAYAEE